MAKKNYQKFKRSFPHYEAMSVEDIVYALEDSLFEMNALLEALSYKKEVSVFIDVADTFLLGEDEDNENCFGVSITVKTDLSEWMWCGDEMAEV